VGEKLLQEEEQREEKEYLPKFILKNDQI